MPLDPFALFDTPQKPASDPEPIPTPVPEPVLPPVSTASGNPERQAIQKMSTKHKVLAQWLMANPTATQNQAAQALGISPAWVSQIVNSDAFHLYLDSLEEGIFSGVVLPLRARLMSVAERAVDKLGQKVDTSEDAAFLLAAADKTLHRLGYAPTRGPEPARGDVNVQQNIYVADRDTLQQARQKMLRANAQNAEQIERMTPALPLISGVEDE